MDIRDRLEAHFDELRSETPRPDLGTVMERGDTFKRRRRLVAVAMPAAAILAVAVGVLALRPPPDGGGLTQGGADAMAADNAILSDRQLNWAEVTPATLGWNVQSAITEDVLYVLSTAPGAKGNPGIRTVPEAIYATTNGTDWDAHLVETTWIFDIASRDGLLYAVGTAPGADADSVALQVGVSEDGGASFQTTLIDGSDSLVRPRLVVTGGGMLATGGAVEPDHGRLTGSATYWSANGVTFEEIEDPFDSKWVLDSYQVGDTAVVATEGAGGGMELWASDDARTWQPIANGIEIGWVSDIGRMRDEFVILATSNDGKSIQALRADDLTGPWEPIPIDDLLPASDPENGTFVSLTDTAIDDSGVAIGVSAETQVAGNGNPIAGLIRRVLPDDAPDSPEARAERAMEADPEEAPVEFESHHAVLVSTDLRQWSLSDLGGWTDNLMFGPDGILIASVTGESDNGQPVRIQATTHP